MRVRFWEFGFVCFFLGEEEGREGVQRGGWFWEALRFFGF